MSWKIVDTVAAQVQWDRLRQMGGSAVQVPAALRELLDAESSEARKASYWKLENRVVVQGNLFEAAVPLVPVLLAALLEDISIPARRAVLELLFQIVAGDSHPDEVVAGRLDLGKACRSAAREGIWLLYGELVHRGLHGARDVLEVIEGDRERLKNVASLIPGPSQYPSKGVRARPD